VSSLESMVVIDKNNNNNNTYIGKYAHTLIDDKEFFIFMHLLAHILRVFAYKSRHQTL